MFSPQLIRWPESWPIYGAKIQPADRQPPASALENFKFFIKCEYAFDCKYKYIVQILVAQPSGLSDATFQKSI